MELHANLGGLTDNKNDFKTIVLIKKNKLQYL